jgi:hypothetical protein
MLAENVRAAPPKNTRDKMRNVRLLSRLIQSPENYVGLLNCRYSISKVLGQHFLLNEQREERYLFEGSRTQTRGRM